MSQWPECKLEKLLKIKHGYAFKGEYFSIAGELILLTPGNINPMGGLKLKGDKEKFYIGNFPDEYLLHKGDLLIVMTDLTQEASILGGAFLIDKDNKYLHNQRLGLVTHNEKVDRQFLYYYCNWQYFRDQVKASSNGATVKHTAPERIYKCRINLPPLLIQKKIAAVLSTYDDLIENNNRRIAILEKMAEEIYREWFVRMRFPGHEKVKFHKGVPEGWEEVPTQTAFQFTGGGTPSKKIFQYWDDGNINWYTPSDITDADGFFLFESGMKCTEEGVKRSSAKIFPPYSIMLTSRATIGALGINTTPACTNQGFITCIPNKRYPLAFLYYWLKLNKPYFEILASGATFSELIKSTFRKIHILTPPKDIIEQYENKLLPVFKVIELLLSKNNALKQSRDLLLSRLLSGKLSVENLDIKFPPGMEEADA